MRRRLGLWAHRPSTIRLDAEAKFLGGFHTRSAWRGAHARLALFLSAGTLRIAYRIL